MGSAGLASRPLCTAAISASLVQPEEIQKKVHPPVDAWSAGEAISLDEEILINHNWDVIRRTMWNYVGIVRNTKRLQLAKYRIEDIQKEIKRHYSDYYVTDNMIELRNISFIAILIIEAAMHRKESRGLHYITEYPMKLKSMQKWHVFERAMHKKGWHMKYVDDYRIAGE